MPRQLSDGLIAAESAIDHEETIGFLDKMAEAYIAHISSFDPNYAATQRPKDMRNRMLDLYEQIES